MGNDGGSIGKLHNLKLNIDKDTLNRSADDNTKHFGSTARWKYCKLSNKPLQLPIVSDYKGHIYNKESILEWLLLPKHDDYSKVRLNQFKYIRKLNDVVELRNIKQVDDEESMIQCKFGEDTFGKGTASLIYISTCGDVLPKRSLYMVEDTKCPVCQKPYSSSDITVINPETQEVKDALEDRMKRLIKNGIYHNGVQKKLKNKKNLAKRSLSDDEEANKRRHISEK